MNQILSASLRSCTAAQTPCVLDDFFGHANQLNRLVPLCQELAPLQRGRERSWLHVESGAVAPWRLRQTYCPVLTQWQS